MGLDTSHNAWHGAYSSFNWFRREIAAKLGFNLNSFEGYGGTIPFDTLKDDDIRILLDHSDCDGEIPPEDCAKLSKRLKEIAPLFEESHHPYNMRSLILQFANGCDEAFAKNEVLDFH